MSFQEQHRPSGGEARPLGGKRSIEDVQAFCEVLGIERPVVLGQSFGGIVALGVAIRHPDLPLKLVVSSSIARFRLDRALPMFERLGGEKARTVAETFFSDPNQENFEAFMATCLPLYNPTPLDPDVLARVRLRPEVSFHFFRGEGFAYDWFGDLGRIGCPTLILAGELDPITPVADQEDMAAAIPESRLEVFTGAGHGVFRDKPKEALAAIRDFILS
jgi:proline iminopeptidase